MGFHNIFVFHGLFESVFIEFNYIFRGAFRGDNSAGGAVPFIIVAEFAECRNVRQLGVALFIKYAEDTEFGIFTVNQFDDVGDFGTGEIYFALAESKELVSGTTVRNGIVFKFRGLGEKLSGGMVGRLYTVGGSFQLSRVRLCVCNEFLKILPFCVFFDNNDSGFRQVVRNRDNGLFIKGSALLGSERGVGRQIDESQCVSVRFGFGEFRPADFPSAPGLFSMTRVWPTYFLALLASRRAPVSVPEPAL